MLHRFAPLLLVVALWAAPEARAQQQEVFPSLAGEALREALVLHYKTATTFSYDRARDSLFAAVYYEPAEDGGPGTVHCVYTGWPITIDRASATAPRTQAFHQDVNTEHTWPQSKGAGSGNARSDLHHLHPTRADANSSRGNLPFGDVPASQTSRWWYLNTSQAEEPPPPLEVWSRTSSSLRAFQTREDHKGRAARAMFYFYAMYEAEALAADPEFFAVQRDALYAWHAAYPPDSLEHARTWQIASYQGGYPNPFVLDTSLVRRAFFSDPGDALPAFEGLYTFFGTTGCDEQVLDVVAQPALATFAPFSRTGVLCNAGQNTLNSRTWGNGPAPDEGRYVEFRVAAADGHRLALGEGSLLRFVSVRSSSGPQQAEVRYRADAGPFLPLGAWAPGTSNTTTAFSLPELEADSLAFRFYGWDAGSAAGTLRFNDVRLTGRVRPLPVAALDVAGPSGWRMLSAPGPGMTVADLAAQNLVQGVPGYHAGAGANLFTGFDASGWHPPAGGADALPPGHGVLWYLWEDPIPAGPPSTGVGLPFTLTFPGTPSDAPASVPLNAGADGSGGWTLVGNPFAAPLPLAGLWEWAAGGALASGVAQTWDPAVRTYDLLDASDTAAPWMGFWVENADAVSLSFPVPDAALRPEPPARIAFALEATTAAGIPVADRAARVAFRDGEGARAEKLTPLAAAFALLAVEAEDRLLAQEALAWPTAPEEVALVAGGAGLAGPMTLRWHVDGLPETWALTLTDLATGHAVDLSAETAYTFDPEAGRQPEPLALAPALAPDASRGEATAARRFALRIAPPAVGTGTGRAPAAPTLDGVFPNPSAGPVHVAYALPQDGRVTLAVYDVLGRRVATLVDGAEAAGARRVTWAAEGVAGGVYVVRLEAGGAAVTRKLVLVR